MSLPPLSEVHGQFWGNKYAYYRFLAKHSELVEIHKKGGVESIRCQHPCAFYNSIMTVDINELETHCKHESNPKKGITVTPKTVLNEHLQRAVVNKTPCIFDIRCRKELSEYKKLKGWASSIGFVPISDHDGIMFLDLATVDEREELKAPPNYVVEEITTGDTHTIAQWGGCVTASYGFPVLERHGRTPGDFFGKMYATIPCGPYQPLRQYVCRDVNQGRLVIATATLFKDPDSDVAGMYNVCTLKAHRGHGIGLLMSKLILREAKCMGATRCVLQGSPAGQPVYRKLGFVKMSDENGVTLGKFSHVPETWKYTIVMTAVESYMRVFGNTKTPMKVAGAVTVMAVVSAIAYRLLM